MMYFNVASARIIEGFGNNRLPHQNTESALESSDFERDIGIVFMVKLQKGCYVRLTTEDHLRYLNGQILVTPKTSDHRKENNGIGIIHYNGQQPDYPFSYSMNVFMPEERFADILSFVLAGKIPTEIWVKTRGMKPFVEFESIWDTKNDQKLEIASIQFVTPLSADRKIPDFEDISEERFLPPTQEQISIIKKYQEKYNSQVNGINNKLSFIILIIFIASAYQLIFK